MSSLCVRSSTATSLVCLRLTAFLNGTLFLVVDLLHRGEELLSREVCAHLIRGELYRGVSKLATGFTLQRVFFFLFPSRLYNPRGGIDG